MNESELNVPRSIDAASSLPVKVLTGFALLVAALGGVLVSLGPTANAVWGVIVIVLGMAGMILLWHKRNSIEFSLLFVGMPLLLHRDEILLTQVQVGGIPVNAADVVVVAFCLVQGMAAFSRSRRRAQFGPPEWFLLLTLAMMGLLLGVIFENPTYQLLQNARALFFLIGTFMATYSLVSTRDGTQRAFRILVAWGILAALTIWHYGLYHVLRVGEVIEAYNGRLVMSSAVDAIGTAHSVVVTGYLLILCYVMLKPRLPRRVLIFCIALIVFFLASLVFSGVRTAWVQVGLSSLYVLIISKRLRLGPVLAISIGLLVGGVLTVSLLSSLLGVDGQQLFGARANVSESFAGRMAESWEAINSVNQRQNWLWGNGLGAQFTYSNPYYPETEYTSASAHNAYVTYYLNLGIFGLGCILLILWRIFSVTLNGFRASGGQDSQWLFLGANACLVASVIGAFASNVFGITPDAYFSATTAVLWAVTLRLGKLFSVRSMAVAPLGAEGAPSPYAPK